MFRNFLPSTLVLFSCLTPISQIQAQPAHRPITIVVTTAAGGSIDAAARHIAGELSKSLHRTVVVDNRPGAGGNIAAEYVKRSTPDGSTLLMMASSTFTLNPLIFDKLSFDPVKDFTSVAMTAGVNMVLVTHPRLGAKDLKTIIAALKKKSNGLSFGSSGNGSLSQIAGELLTMQTQTQAVHVPYKGNAPALNDLLAGQLDFMFDSGTAAPHVAAGKLDAIAVIGPKRLASYPNVPTFKEAGLEGMEAVSGWHGIFAPAGVPADVVNQLNREINTVLKSNEMREKLNAMGLEQVSSTPAELDRAVQTDIRRLEPVVQRAHIKAN